MEIIFEFFKNNLVNWLVLAGLIIWGWNKAVPSMISKRAKSINEVIEAAEAQRQEAEEFLAEQKGKVANAEEEAKNILKEAKEVAKQMQVDMKAQTEADIEALKQKFEASIENERQIIVTETRKAAVAAAVKVSREYLKNNISDAERDLLLKQFTEQLDSLGSSEQSVVANKGKVGSGSGRS